MSLNSLGLGILISAKDEASRVFQNVSKNFVELSGASDEFVEKMNNNATKMTAGLAVMAGGITGIKTSMIMAEEAGKFELVMANLQAVSGATTKQMQEFRTAILNADHSIYGPVETAHAMQELAQRGFTARQALEMLQPVTDLASASLGQLGLADSAEIATMAIHGFGLKASDTARIVDEMAKAANSSGMAFKDLPLGLGAISRGAQAANQSFEESLIVLGMMRNSIHSIERASNAGSTAMERMVAGTKGSKELQSMVNVFDKSTGQVRSFREIINDLIPKLDAMGVKASKAFIIKAFGTRGLAGVQAVIQQLKNGVETSDGQIKRGADLIAYQNEQLAKAGGTAAKLTEARLSTLPGQMDLLRASMERLEVVLGGPFAQVLKPVVEGILKIIDGVKNGFEKMPASVQKGIAVFVMLGSALLTVFGAFLAGSALMSLFGVTLTGILATAGGLILPLLGVGAAITGLIVLFAGLKESSQQTGKGVVGFFTEMFEKAKLAWEGLNQLFTEGAFSGAVMEEMDKAENSGVKSFAVKVFLWVNRIENFLSGLAEGFRDKVKELEPAFTRVADALGMITEALGLTVGAAKDNEDAFNSAGKAGRSLGNDLGVVAGALANITFFGLMAVQGMLELISGAGSTFGLVVGGAVWSVFGAFQMLFGLLSGDGNTIWKGFFNIAFGVMDALVGMVLLFAKGTAYLIDKINGWTGAGSTDNVAAITDAIKAYKKFSSETHTEALNMAGVPEDKPFNIFAPNATPVPPAPTANNTPAISATQVASGGMMGLLGAFQAAANGPPTPVVINMTNLLKLDRETLAKAQQQIRTEAAARNQVPTFDMNL